MKMLKLVSLTAIVAMGVTAACSSDDDDGGGGGSGNSGGSGGSTGGSGGSVGGSGGSTGGSAGSTGGSAGSTGGSAGSTGGSAGASGSGGVPACDPDAGVRAPKEGPNGECYTCKQVINFEPCALPSGSCGWDTSNPGNGTKSAAKFFAVIGCMCDAANCEADCPEVCIQQEFPTAKCKTCYEAACATELAACNNDDGT